MSQTAQDNTLSTRRRRLASASLHKVLHHWQYVAKKKTLRSLTKASFNFSKVHEVIRLRGIIIQEGLPKLFRKATHIKRKAFLNCFAKLYPKRANFNNLAYNNYVLCEALPKLPQDFTNFSLQHTVYILVWVGCPTVQMSHMINFLIACQIFPTFPTYYLMAI